MPRIVCMLANEAVFAVDEGVAESETIDLAMQLGMNFPDGSLSWAKQIGYAKTVLILDHLHAEYEEERYRTAQLLRKLACHACFGLIYTDSHDKGKIQVNRIFHVRVLTKNANIAENL